MKTSVVIFYLSLFFSTRYSVTERHRTGGGEVVHDLTEFPFLAKLIVVSSVNTARVCVGSLIHPEWILTAGHCFLYNASEIDWMLENEKCVVLMGHVVAHKKTYATQNSFLEIYHHPNYHTSKDRNSNDIAVGKLKTPYNLTKTIQTISLSDSYNDCRYGTIIGVEKTHKRTSRSSTSNIIKFVDAPIINNETMNEMLERFTIFYSDIQTGHPNARYALSNESGGVFICNIGSIAVQVGVMSTELLIDEKIIHVFEKVDLHVDFIWEFVPSVQMQHLRRAAGSKAVSKTSMFYVIIILIYFINYY